MKMDKTILTIFTKMKNMEYWMAYYEKEALEGTRLDMIEESIQNYKEHKNRYDTYYWLVRDLGLISEYKKWASEQEEKEGK